MSPVARKWSTVGWQRLQPGRGLRVGRVRNAAATLDRQRQGMFSRLRAQHDVPQCVELPRRWHEHLDPVRDDDSRLLRFVDFMAPKKKTTRTKRPARTRQLTSPRTPKFVAAVKGSDRSGAHSAAREVSWAEFQRVVQQLAREISKKFRPDAVVGVAHGGVFVGGALAVALEVEFYPVRISRRSRDQGVAAAPKLSGVMPKELKGRRVVIVDDIAASGDTLQLAAKLAGGAGAKAVATTALICRPKGFEPDFYWEKSTDFFVFPWDYDLSIDERFRALM